LQRDPPLIIDVRKPMPGQRVLAEAEFLGDGSLMGAGGDQQFNPKALDVSANRAAAISFLARGYRNLHRDKASRRFA